MAKVDSAQLAAELRKVAAALGNDRTPGLKRTRELSRQADLLPSTWSRVQGLLRFMLWRLENPRQVPTAHNQKIRNGYQSKFNKNSF